MRIALSTRCAIALPALPIIFASGWSLAQNAPPSPARIQVTVYQIKPEMLTEWEQFQKTESMEASKKAGYKARSIWQTATFGPGFRFVRVMPTDKFAAFDEPSPLIRTLGQVEADKLSAKARRMFGSVETVALQLRDDLSFPKELSDQQRRIAVVHESMKDRALAQASPFKISGGVGHSGRENCEDPSVSESQNYVPISYGYSIQ